MSNAAVITRLHELHEKAKAGTLSPGEAMDYDRFRRQLMSVATAAQASTYGGQPRRGNIRVALVLKVEVVFGDDAPQSATTVDVSDDGFSALLAFAAGVGAKARFSLRQAGVDPIAGTCRIAGVMKQGGLQRVNFAIDELAPSSRKRLELLVFDHLLQRLPAAGRR